MEVNASTDGKKIYMTRGIVHFTQNDNELAGVMGHELGHAIMRHSRKKGINRFIGLAAGTTLDQLGALLFADDDFDTFTDIGFMAGHLTHSPQFELEADYVGYYITARAGYDYNEAANWYRRIAVYQSPLSIEYETTHPANAERFVIGKKVLAEIDAKKAAGEVLKPDVDPAEWSRRNLEYAHGQDTYNR